MVEAGHVWRPLGAIGSVSDVADRLSSMGGISLSPAKLRLGDVIMVPRESLRVVAEPLLVHTGMSPFDEFELHTGAYVRHCDADDGPTEFRTWNWKQNLVVLRPAPDESDGTPTRPTR
jgi:hypothetical protein